MPPARHCEERVARRGNPAIKILLLLTCTLLTACAFHLATVYQLPDAYHNMRLIVPQAHQNFAKRLRARLLTSGVQCTDKATPLVLRITHISVNRPPSSTYHGVQTRVYTLTYQITFTLSRHDTHILGPQTLTSKRTTVLKTTQALHSDDELTVITHAMESELINKMLYSIARANPDNNSVSITDRTGSNASRA